MMSSTMMSSTMMSSTCARGNLYNMEDIDDEGDDESYR
jgi:hypothetical protein